MGCRVLDAGDDGACLYCSTSMTAFGPVFDSADDAESFMHWLKYDPRMLNSEELGQRYTDWLIERDEWLRKIDEERDE